MSIHSETKNINIGGQDFILHKFPAMTSRKFSVLYLPSILPKIGSYSENEILATEALSYVSVEDNNAQIFLSSIELIDKYVPRDDAKNITYLELALFDYNYDFLENGLVSNFFGGLAQDAKEFLTKIVNNGLEQLFQAVKPPSEN